MNFSYPFIRRPIGTTLMAIGIMLAGAFPMVYLIRKYLARPVESLGRRIGLATAGAAGMLAAAANILAMFRLVKDMRARDKVLVIAFAVCAAFMFVEEFRGEEILAALHMFAYSARIIMAHAAPDPVAAHVILE